MVALLLTHQLWPTLLGQNHMVALLLTHQLCTSCADICLETPFLFVACLFEKISKCKIMNATFAKGAALFRPQNARSKTLNEFIIHFSETYRMVQLKRFLWLGAVRFCCVFAAFCSIKTQQDRGASRHWDLAAVFRPSFQMIQI